MYYVAWPQPYDKHSSHNKQTYRIERVLSRTTGGGIGSMIHNYFCIDFCTLVLPKF